MHEKYEIGNAQTIGSYEIQSNYFSVRNTNTVFAVLADGNRDHINGRNAAILAVETGIREFLKNPLPLSMEEFFDALSMRMIRNIKECIYLGKTPNVSICIAYVEGDTLHSFTVGDTQIGLVDGNAYRLLNDRNGTCKISSTATLILMSKGVYEALTEVELLSYLSKGIAPYEKAQRIIEEVNKKRIKRAKNATIILVERRM